MSSLNTNHEKYDVNIGIEVHVQLNTKSKIFCCSKNTTSNSPNTDICPVCMGYPGVLPVLNEEVINYAIMAGLATNCTINQESIFARKHYFYPDLPKNYQISQHDKPICINGYISIPLDNGQTKKIRLIRIHIEEDAGKNIHAPQSQESFVDLNRTGTPLLEIVSEPDIASAAEARAYLKALRNIVMYLNICTGNMEDGAFRADTNISVRLKNAQKLGTRCELKNINSFKFIGDATEYEIARQIELIESGQEVIQQTRSWDTKEHVTFALRNKEESADYRYFSDPDLPLVKIESSKIESIKKSLPELPNDRLERLMSQHNLNFYEADILINDQELAQYFEQARTHSSSSQLINWVLRDIIKLAKDSNLRVLDLSVTPEKLAELINLIDTGVINARTAQELFGELIKSNLTPKELVKKLGLEQVGSEEELHSIISTLLKENPTQVSDYKSGKEKLFGFFVGKVMAQTKGRGNPEVINKLLKELLNQ